MLQRPAKFWAAAMGRKYLVSVWDSFDYPNGLRCDGDWVTYTDHAALVARVREAFNRINLQPWKDCACEVCIANGEAWRDLLAALGPETPKA